MPQPEGLFFVDAHEDLAYHCQEHARDLVDPGDVQCMVTLPLLLATGVRLVCATLFTPHNQPPEVRRGKLEQQWQMYQHWLAEYPDVLRPVRSRADLDALAQAGPCELLGTRGHPVGMILLMEGCELLERPAELELWHDRGLRIASLTWNGVNRYASGTFGDASGLTAEGFELLQEFQRLGIILDISHLADAGVENVFESYNGPLCATHSNSRSVAFSERNLLDSQAQELARRGGVMGLNLLASFVRGGWRDGDPLPPVQEATEHLEYFAGLVGPSHLGLGSDLDGGLTPLNTPEGIDRIDQLHLLLDDLRARGWDESRIAGFSGGNWWRFFERSLPA